MELAEFRKWINEETGKAITDKSVTIQEYNVWLKVQKQLQKVWGIMDGFQ